jgi:hypothetical protein
MPLAVRPLANFSVTVTSCDRIQTDPRPVETQAPFLASEKCRRAFHEHFDAQDNMTDTEVLHPEVGFAATLHLGKSFDVVCSTEDIEALTQNHELRVREHT